QRADLAVELDIVVVNRQLQAVDEGRRVYEAYREGITFFRSDVRVAARNLFDETTLGIPRITYVDQRHGSRREQLAEVAGADVTGLADAEAQVRIHFPGSADLPGGHITRAAVVRGTRGKAQIHCFGKLDTVDQRNRELGIQLIDVILAVDALAVRSLPVVTGRIGVDDSIDRLFAVLVAEGCTDRTGPAFPDVTTDVGGKNLLLNVLVHPGSTDHVTLGFHGGRASAEQVEGHAVRVVVVRVVVDIDAANDAAVGIKHCINRGLE